MEDRPSRTVMLVGGAIVGAIWIGTGTLAWQGTWWPLIVVLCIAGSAGLVSLGMAIYMRGRSGAPVPARLEREGAEAVGRAGPIRGSVAPARMRPESRGKAKNRKRRKSGRKG